MSNSLNRGISTPIAITIIIVLAVLLVGGALGYQYWWTEEEATPPETVAPKDETAGWKTYRNEEYGFEIRYPQNVLVIERDIYDMVDFSIIGTECDPRLRCPPPFMIIGPIYIPSFAEITADASLEELIKETLMLKEFKEFHISPEESNWSVDVVEKATFGEKNIQGYLIHDWAQAHGKCTYYAKEKNYSIRISRSGGGLKYSECENDPLFNQMLSTFRFTD